MYEFEWKNFIFTARGGKSVLVQEFVKCTMYFDNKIVINLSYAKSKKDKTK